MRFQVRHVTAYTYTEPVRLGPHWVRLRSRGGDAIDLNAFALDVDPRPAGCCECLDVDGNRVSRASGSPAKRDV